MGRLILNVLLSFAQFEREVTANESETRLQLRSVEACGWEESSRGPMTRRQISHHQPC